jgi:hypothetical protein
MSGDPVKGVLLATAALLVAMTGCGGGDDGAQSTQEDSSSALVEQPSAKRPISAEIAGFELALEDKSCEAFQPYVFSTVRSRPPGAPATRSECREEGFLVSAYARRVRHPVSDSREYGTFALMESPAGNGHREYTFWVLDSDGRFRFIESDGVFDPQIGTEFEDRADAERAAKDFIHAVDEHDCPALLRALHENSRFVTDQEGPHATCSAVLDGVYFAPAIQATPNPKIDVIGGTRTFAFIGVPTASAYFTLSIGQSTRGGMRVVDVLPNTPLEPGEV